MIASGVPMRSPLTARELAVLAILTAASVCASVVLCYALYAAVVG